MHFADSNILIDLFQHPVFFSGALLSPSSPIVASLSTASREILWNVPGLLNVVLMYSLLGLSSIVALIGLIRHFELINSGRPNPPPPPFLESVSELFRAALFQRETIRDLNRNPLPALAHTLVYVGCLVLLFTTTMVFIDHDLGIRIYRGEFYLAVTLLSDIFGAAVLIGILLFAHRRYIQQASRLHTRGADGIMLACLALLVVQGFTLEGLRIHVTDDPWAAWSPVGLLVAKFFWPLSDKAASQLHFFTWWFHTATVFAALAVLPYTKFLHFLSSACNLYFRNLCRPKGQLESPGDIGEMMEKGEEPQLGLGTISDYSWKGLLDLEACTSCGRCQEVCPAYQTGKPLSPKWMILDTRNHALALNASGALENSVLPKALQKFDQLLNEQLFFPSHGLQKSSPEQKSGWSYEKGFRSSQNEQVENAARSIGASKEALIAGEVMDENVFWTCTTCMACVEACPVGINHVDHIVGNRRHMALMRGEIPSEAQATLRSLENRQNPYGDPNDRSKWFFDLDLPLLEAGGAVDYLYWVGCVSAYDQRKQKIARSLVSLMRKAGLNFGVLGNAEGCSGDPARRLGEENLYQTLAKSNLEILKSVKFKVLVANCPHCFNTIKNEYPQFGNLGDGKSPEIIHHSQLLQQLLDEKKISLKETASTKKITFHDPCYLGRYNDEYDAPREVVRKSSAFPILEMEKSREKGLCCGAGGGHFWMDLKIGSRVNQLRAEQAFETGADTIATACPFCMHMMEDGVKLINKDDSLVIKDIAELLDEATV